MLVVKVLTKEVRTEYHAVIGLLKTIIQRADEVKAAAINTKGIVEGLGGPSVMNGELRPMFASFAVLVQNIEWLKARLGETELACGVPGVEGAEANVYS